MSAIIICDCCGGRTVSANQVWVTGPSIAEAGGRIAHVCPVCIVEVRLWELLFEDVPEETEDELKATLARAALEGDDNE